MRIEHFTPHEGKSPALKYDWNNLFWSCDYCNGIKSNTYNKNGKDILNSTTTDVESLISHKISSFPILEPEISSKQDGYKENNTVELLSKVFLGKTNSSPAQILKREDLIKNLKNEMSDFFNIIFKLLNPDTGINEKESLIYKLKDHLEDSSNFIEFKREYLNNNINLKNKIAELLK